MRVDSSAPSDSPSLRRSAVEAAGLIYRTSPAALVAYALATLAQAVAPVVVVWLTKLIVDGLTGEAVSATRLVTLAIVLAVAGVVAATGPSLSQFLSNQIGRQVAVRSVDRLFAAADRFVGLGPFENPAFLDRLRMAQQSTQTMSQFLADVFGFGSAALTFLGFIGALLAISPIVTLIVVASALPSLWAEFRLARKRAGTARDIAPHQRREFFYSQLLASVPAAKEIRLFGLGGFLRGRMMTERTATNVAERRMDRSDLLTHGGLGLLSSVVAGAGLIWAVLAAHRGRLTIGDVAVFATTVPAVQSSLSALVRTIAGVHQRLLLLDHYTKVVHSPPDLPLAASPVPVAPLRTGIELRDVWFRYSDDHPWVLRGVTLRIPYGRAVALVGLNGAGKSTLIKLLCRLYDPGRGSIQWDGVDLREVDPAQLRSRISAVFQDHMCYDFSASDNVGVGDLAALDDPARIRVAAELAGVHDRLAALPRGYDTMLTRMYTSGADKDNVETGVVLSGGQWQRLALARAFLRDDRDLMILDEPSSGLDPQAEHDVHERMLRYRADRTSLLISHRLNAIRQADEIAVLDDGVISERGSHEALMALDGAYARLFRLQASGYRDESVGTASALGS